MGDRVWGLGSGVWGDGFGPTDDDGVRANSPRPETRLLVLLHQGHHCHLAPQQLPAQLLPVREERAAVRNLLRILHRVRLDGFWVAEDDDGFVRQVVEERGEGRAREGLGSGVWGLGRWAGTLRGGRRRCGSRGAPI